MLPTGYSPAPCGRGVGGGVSLAADFHGPCHPHARVAGPFEGSLLPRAIAHKLADPERIAIYGASYGGYAALAGVTFTPDKFACAVDIFGISNLSTMMATVPPYWKPVQTMWKARMGDYTTETGQRFLQERSPLTYVDRIIRPLLIAQGANDVRVKPSESDQIVEAMRQRAIPVTYIWYSDEGHGFSRAQNRRSEGNPGSPTECE